MLEGIARGDGRNGLHAHGSQLGEPAVEQLHHVLVARAGGLAAEHSGDDVASVALHRAHQVEAGGAGIAGLDRSEEHTSELQSLMRISYAVFCLKKKNNNLPHENTAVMASLDHTLSHDYLPPAFHYILTDTTA